MQVIVGLAVFLMALWFLAIIFHYYFIPKLDVGAVEDIVRFVVKFKMLRMNYALPLPAVNEVNRTELKIPEYAWSIYNGLVGEPWENYHKVLNRIFLAPGCRQNILVHALVHYVQFNYVCAVLSDKEKEEEAWRITRRYIKVHWPVRYRLMGILCLGLEWWTSEPY